MKFKTDRAAEVGRLIGGLGRLGRHMAALPQKTEGTKATRNLYALRAPCSRCPDLIMEDAPLIEQSTAGSAVQATPAPNDNRPQQQTGGAAGKKKKKGKK